MKNNQELKPVPKAEEEKAKLFPWFVGLLVVALLVVVALVIRQQANDQPYQLPKSSQTDPHTLDQYIWPGLDEYPSSRHDKFFITKRNALKYCNYRIRQEGWWSVTTAYFKGQKNLILKGEAKKETIIEFDKKWKIATRNKRR